MRAVIAVALAALIIGGLSGFILGEHTNDGGDRFGPGGFRGGPGFRPQGGGIGQQGQQTFPGSRCADPIRARSKRRPNPRTLAVVPLDGKG